MYWKYDNYRKDTRGEPLTPLLARLTAMTPYGPHEVHKYALSFRTLRRLNEHDTRLLRRFADTLPLHSRSARPTGTGAKGTPS
jgi:hypothetical protein